jgi:hypothetical protein
VSIEIAKVEVGSRYIHNRPGWAHSSEVVTVSRKTDSSVWIEDGATIIRASRDGIVFSLSEATPERVERIELAARRKRCERLAFEIDRAVRRSDLAARVTPEIEDGLRALRDLLAPEKSAPSQGGIE